VNTDTKCAFFLEVPCSVAASSEITRVLSNVTAGKPGATDRLLPLVYDELRSLAAWSLRSERKNHTLQATALVHEVYVRLTGERSGDWRDRAHFFAAAAQAIRRILIDHARKQGRRKRGGGAQRLPLDSVVLVAPEQDFDVLALDAALTELAREHPRQARVVELRFYGGLTLEETAEVLGVVARTVERDWQFARAWLYRKLAPDETP